MPDGRRRALAALLLVFGLGSAALLATGFGEHARRIVVLELLAPVLVLLGGAGLVRPGVIGRDPDLTPTDRRLQMGLVVGGLVVGGAMVWVRL